MTPKARLGDIVGDIGLENVWAVSCRSPFGLCSSVVWAPGLETRVIGEAFWKVDAGAAVNWG